ncbi:MAG: sulfate permease [Halomonadaceae bacterium]|nr:MAG: sulfate permease [Halomonadaceae bacterium]
MPLKRYFPILSWLPDYNRQLLASDSMAAVIVTVMLIPQSLAYALLAGLPAEVGLYASIVPLLIYAIFGTSRTLAVGPVAVVSLMTAAAVGSIAVQGTGEYLTAAITLAFLSGILLTLMGLFRLGFFANFLSHPVISGFITAAGLIIATSQVGQMLGVKLSGHTLVELLSGLLRQLHGIHWLTLTIGAGSLAFLLGVRRYLKPLLSKVGFEPRTADLVAKAGPVFAVTLTTLLVWGLQLDQRGVQVVGTIPAGLPGLALPSFDLSLWQQLFIPALLISIVGFVESVSVAQTLAAKRRQRIEPDQELIGLGTANLGSAFAGGFPVTGGIARSVVNFDAGAATPAAGAFTAIGIALATLFLTPLLEYLPVATLAATIIIAVLSLVDFGVLKRTWRYSRSDFMAMLATILATLVAGVEIGIATGVGLSLALFLYKTSQPHSAIVGHVANSEHFRNVKRFKVETDPHIILLRIDENLYFGNARYLEDTLYDLVARKTEVTDVVLICASVSYIDATALESLEAINARFKDAHVKLHLSEVKGPVMDQLQRTPFISELSGKVFLTTFSAWRSLKGQLRSYEPVQ